MGEEQIVETVVEAAPAVVAPVVAKTASKSALKSGLIIGGSAVATLGVGVGIYFLVKHIKKKNAEKAATAQPTVAAQPVNSSVGK